MKYIYSKIILLILTAILVVSCDDYLGVEPRGQRLLETTEDYNMWLDNQRLHQSAIRALTFFSDLRDMPEIDDVWDSFNELCYTWQPQLSDMPYDNSPIWSTSYGDIYYYNAVINEVLDSRGGTMEQRQSLRAEALLGRALIYLNLINLYGKAYNENTAEEDLAVPFITSNDVTDDTPPRLSVAQMYNSILSDLEEALPYLPEDNSSNRFRGSVAAAYAVMARAYLYMGRFESAAENAQMALDNGPNEIIFKRPGEGQDYLYREDIILARKGGSMYYTSVIPTIDFLQSFDVDDQRLQIHYEGLEDMEYPYEFTTRGQIVFSPNGVVPGDQNHPNWGLDVAEMNLIMAEAAARSGDLEMACNQLHMLRSKRFLPEDYEKFESDNAREVLDKIIQERKFEFAFTGLRWYDMKRLAAEGMMSTVERRNAMGNVIVSLEPTSDRYVLQIPLQILSFNEDWEQNP